MDDMPWVVSHRADARALPLANRHYNRQTPESPQFVPPGSCLVLLTPSADALWVSLMQIHQDHAWAGSWVNCLFRNESNVRSSHLITHALAATRHAWGDPPMAGMITFVDPGEIRSVNPGYCYKKAGFSHVGYTKARKLHALKITPGLFPEPRAARGGQYNIFDTMEKLNG